MIIYGSKASHVKSIQLDKETCSHCGTQGSIVLSTYSRYAHLFWIPFFSVGRLSASQCTHCKQVLELKQMPAQIRAYHERNLAETRLPIWQFSGLVLLLVAIVFGAYTNGLDKEQQAQLLQAPQSGDVYEWKTRSGAYTTFRVVGMHSDTLTVNFNNYQVDKISGIYNIDKIENYSDSVYQITSTELQKMYAAGEILDINRH